MPIAHRWIHRRPGYPSRVPRWRWQSPPVPASALRSTRAAFSDLLVEADRDMYDAINMELQMAFETGFE